MVSRFDSRRLTTGSIAALRRVGFRVADRLRRVWWRIARPSIRGSAAALFDENGRILLIRHGYGSGRWSLPGGGIGRHEDPLDAALRECCEETGLEPRDLRFVDLIVGDLFGARNHVNLFVGRVSGEPQVDGIEIVAAAFFPIDALPANLARRAGPWIAEALAAQNKSN